MYPLTRMIPFENIGSIKLTEQRIKEQIVEERRREQEEKRARHNFIMGIIIGSGLSLPLWICILWAVGII